MNARNMVKYKNIIIIGPNEFLKQTVKALKLIEKKSKKDFNKINNYLKIIKLGRYSRMLLKQAQFNVGKPTAFSPIEWYASTIVHDTYHYILHSTERLLWKKRNYSKHEKLCINEQLIFLRKIKAPKYMIEHCKKFFEIKHWTLSYKKKHPAW